MLCHPFSCQLSLSLSSSQSILRFQIVLTVWSLARRLPVTFGVTAAATTLDLLLSCSSVVWLPYFLQCLQYFAAELFGLYQHSLSVWLSAILGWPVSMQILQGFLLPPFWLPPGLPLAVPEGWPPYGTGPGHILPFIHWACVQASSQRSDGCSNAKFYSDSFQIS